MSRWRAVYFLLCFVLVFGVLGGLAGSRPALAANENINGAVLSVPNQEQPELPESLDLTCLFPVLRAKSGNSYEFKVGLQYYGSAAARTFQLAVTTPQDWVAAIVPDFGTTEISAIQLQPFQSYPENVKITAVPYPWALPEPGEYVITLTAISGDIRETLDLTAVVTARYEFTLTTDTGRLNTEATAGKESHVSIQMINSGSAAIESAALTSTNPEGWNISFNPEKIDSLDAGLTQEIDVTIQPPAKAIAGDYSITLRADSTEVSDNIELRVTVLTPTIWGWVGIIIVLVVVAGLVVLFRQLGRR